MSKNTPIDYRNPTVIRKLGQDALLKELGPVGMAYFIRQFDSGNGDYTAERDEYLKDFTLEEAREKLLRQGN